MHACLRSSVKSDQERKPRRSNILEGVAFVL